MDRRRLVVKAEINEVTNPGAEIDTAGWVTTSTYRSNAGATLTRVTSEHHSGVASFQVVTTATANQGIDYPTINVVAGIPKTVSCWVFGSGAGEEVRLRIGDATVGHASSPSTILAPGWQRFTVTLTPVASGTTGIAIVQTPALAQAFWVDDVIVGNGTVIDGESPITVLRDFENGSTMQSVKNSWTVTPGARQPTMARSQRRYGGSRQAGEQHDNGAIGWQAVVYGATADACTANVEAVLGDIEAMVASTQDVYVEWRPDGSTVSTYYEVRGPATWTGQYKWDQFVGAGTMTVDIRIPVGPLAELASYSIPLASTTVPVTIALIAEIEGTAPARASIALTTSGGSAAPIWALLGWVAQPSTPLAGSVKPFGLHHAKDTIGTLATWAATADANYMSGTGLKATAAGAGTASAEFPIDPSVLASDAFSRGEVNVEVWARIEIAATVVAPKLFLSLRPFAGTSFGAEQFSAEFGNVGKPVTLPSSGTHFRFVKVGTLNLPVNPAQPLKHNLVVAASWATGSSGQFGLDYLVMVPVRQRALSPSSKANDGTYPKFIASTGATTKTIRHDLSGAVASGTGNPGRDAGLGGSMIELPPGDVEFVVKLSSLVADDPTIDATTEQISHTGVTGLVRVTPRVYLAG